MLRIVLTTLFALFLATAFACKESAAPAKPATAETTKAAQPDQPASQPTPTSFAEKPAVGTAAKCPVTGEEFEVADDTVVVEHEGRFYAFCCAGCDEDFKNDLAKYAK